MRSHFRIGDRVCAMGLSHSVPTGHTAPVGEGELVGHSHIREDVTLVRFDSLPQRYMPVTTSSLHHMGGCDHPICAANLRDCEIH